jgi:hypothetical protein
MKILFGPMFKVAGLAFVLVAAVHFAAPPSAAASCRCNNLSFNTSTFAGVGTSCNAANAFLDNDIVNYESAACNPNAWCNLQPIVITSACHLRSDGMYEVDGYQRYACYIGTTCPAGY